MYILIILYTIFAQELSESWKIKHLLFGSSGWLLWQRPIGLSKSLPDPYRLFIVYSCTCIEGSNKIILSWVEWVLYYNWLDKWNNFCTLRITYYSWLHKWMVSLRSSHRHSSMLIGFCVVPHRWQHSLHLTLHHLVHLCSSVWSWPNI